MKTTLRIAALLAATSCAVPALAEGVLRLDEAPVGELDPAKASDYADSILMFNVYDALIGPSMGSPEFQGLIAKDWKNEGNVVTFNLRPDLTFHSGNPVTAADVVFSFERMIALGKGVSYLFAGRVEAVEAVDDLTVKFTLGEPYAPFIAALTRLPIVDSVLVKANLGEGDTGMGDWGQAFLSTNDAGSGAYQVIKHNPQEETVMSKVAGYYGFMDGKAPGEVHLRYGMEPTTVRTSITRGEHDIASQWLPPEVARAVANDGGQLLVEKSSGGFYMKLNTQRAPLDDVHCRRAVVKAIDYETLLKMVSVNGEIAAGSPSTGILAAGMLGAGRNPVMKQDIEGAKAELAKCRYDVSSMPIEVAWISEVAIEERFALLAQANLNAIGFPSEIKAMPWAAFTEAVSDPAKTPHVNQLYNATNTSDPDPLLFGAYHSSSAGTWSASEHLNDPKVDALIEEGRRETDVAKRADIYAELEAYLLEQAVSVFGFDRASVFAASARVNVPALSADPSKQFGLDTYGFSFRYMQMQGE